MAAHEVFQRRCESGFLPPISNATRVPRAQGPENAGVHRNWSRRSCVVVTAMTNNAAPLRPWSCPLKAPALDRYQRIDVVTPWDGDGRFARRMCVFRRLAAMHTLDTLQPNCCVVVRFAADARRSTGVCLMTEWHVGPPKPLCTGRTAATCRPAPACDTRRWLATRAPAPCSARVRADRPAPRCAAPRPGWRPLNYAAARRARCRRCDGDDAVGDVGGAGGVFGNCASNASASPPAP
jgi:hypothetical protein